MADVSHELGALRFVVDSPLSSKVAMFNTHAQKHQESQHLNPFSGSHERSVSPKPQIPRDQYGKPLAGSMTEMRGQKANMHVLREMLELCQIINSEGYEVKDEPKMRVIPFGELFNIYNYISDKVVGILLRARKHKYVEFEGEMLFQRRDDDVPIFLLRPIVEIRGDIEAKIDSIKRATSPSAPQSTSVLMDKAAHHKKLQDAGLVVPKSGSRAASKSRTPSPNTDAAKPPVKSSSKPPSPARPAAAAATEAPIIPEPTTEPAKETVIAPTKEAESVVVAEAPVQTQAPEIVVMNESSPVPESNPAIDQEPTQPATDAMKESTPDKEESQLTTVEPTVEPLDVAANDISDINNNSDNENADKPIETVVAVNLSHEVTAPTVPTIAVSNAVDDEDNSTSTVEPAAETETAADTEIPVNAPAAEAVVAVATDEP